ERGRDSLTCQVDVRISHCWATHGNSGRFGCAWSSTMRTITCPMAEHLVITAHGWSRRLRWGITPLQGCQAVFRVKLDRCAVEEQARRLGLSPRKLRSQHEQAFAAISKVARVVALITDAGE